MSTLKQVNDVLNDLISVEDELDSARHDLAVTLRHVADNIQWKQYVAMLNDDIKRLEAARDHLRLKYRVLRVLDGH